MNTPNTTALARAIEQAGGPTSLARAVGAPSGGAVKAWRISGVPAAYCPAIERETGVPCEELRPDVDWGVLRASRRRRRVAEAGA